MQTEGWYVYDIMCHNLLHVPVYFSTSITL